jgi:hypothetical protein
VQHAGTQPATLRCARGPQVTRPSRRGHQQRSPRTTWAYTSGSRRRASRKHDHHHDGRVDDQDIIDRPTTTATTSATSSTTMATNSAATTAPDKTSTLGGGDRRRAYAFVPRRSAGTPWSARAFPRSPSPQNPSRTSPRSHNGAQRSVQRLPESASPVAPTMLSGRPCQTRLRSTGDDAATLSRLESAPCRRGASAQGAASRDEVGASGRGPERAVRTGARARRA